MAKLGAKGWAALALGMVAGAAIVRLGLHGKAHPIELTAEIVVDLPTDRVFMAWSDLEQHPGWFTHVEEVVVYGDGRVSCWVVKGPGGWPLEFDVKLTSLEPGRLLAWRTLSGSALKHNGHVTFQAEGEGTRVTVRAWWTPPPGVLGRALAAASGSAGRVLAAELERMKAALELRGNECSNPA